MPASGNLAPLFWDVDTQVDFMLPHGKLYAAGAEQIIPNLARLTQFARDKHILLVSSMDAHRPNDPEFADWPPHCIVGTDGQRKLCETLLEQRLVLPPAAAELPRDPEEFQQVIVEKRTIDVFTNPNVDRLLARLGKREITLYGVVTEVCVQLGACGLIGRGYNVRVVTDAIRALKEESGQEALELMKRSGAQLVTADEVVSEQKFRLAS